MGELLVYALYLSPLYFLFSHILYHFVWNLFYILHHTTFTHIYFTLFYIVYHHLHDAKYTWNGISIIIATLGYTHQSNFIIIYTFYFLHHIHQLRDVKCYTWFHFLTPRSKTFGATSNEVLRCAIHWLMLASILTPNLVTRCREQFSAAACWLPGLYWIRATPTENGFWCCCARNRNVGRIRIHQMPSKQKNRIFHVLPTAQRMRR